MSAPILVADGLRKTFGSVVALDRVGIALHPGRVTAIVGENGAGKSTLAKILAGISAPDAGSLRIDGRPAAFRRRGDAVAAGVGFVPQSLSFIATLTLIENHIIGQPGWRADPKGVAKALAAASRELGVGLPLDLPLGRLSLPQRQLGEIASAVGAGARILLLDEPTSSLGPLEIENLVAAIRRLARSGVAIGLVTHRITEVLNGADHVTVLRAGRPIFEGPTTGLDADGIAHFMVGAAVPESRKPAPPREEIRLSVDRIAARDSDGALLDDVSFSARSGEIVGVCGVTNVGQGVLTETLAGLRRPTAGRVRVLGRDIAGDPAAARAWGVAHIPEERAHGIVPDLTVAENASLLHLSKRRFTRFGLRRRGAERRYGERVAEQWDVRPRRVDLPARALSGGNQQKLLIGRELECKPVVIIAHSPTQGLDIAAAAEIRQRLIDAAAGGAAIVITSADLDEILSMSHRVIVFSNGRITDDFVLDDAPIDMVRLGRAIGGQSAADTRTRSPPALPPRRLA